MKRQETLDEHMSDGAPQRRPFRFDTPEGEKTVWARSLVEALAYAEHRHGRARPVL